MTSRGNGPPAGTSGDLTHSTGLSFPWMTVAAPADSQEAESTFSSENRYNGNHARCSRQSNASVADARNTSFGATLTVMTYLLIPNGSFVADAAGTESRRRANWL